MLSDPITMISALEQCIEWRLRECRNNRWSDFTSSKERPGILVAIDELHQIRPAGWGCFEDVTAAGKHRRKPKSGSCPHRHLRAVQTGQGSETSSP